jgi:hypothetical protein
VVERLTALTRRYLAQGRSTAGAAQKNDVEMSLAEPGTPPRNKGRKSAAD